MNTVILAKRLKELRKTYNYNQEFVASYLNIGRQAYSHYETGRNTPSAETLYKLADLYHISLETLIGVCSSSEIGNIQNHFSYFIGSDTLSDFLKYTSNNEKKLKSLTGKEKELLYFFHLLSSKEQEDILDFIKMKALKT